MTWSLQAIGHVPEELEHEIADKLHELLSDPRFGAEVYHFAGDFVTRDLLHTAPIQTAPGLPEAPAAESEPAATAEQAPADGTKAPAAKAAPESPATKQG